MKSIVKITSIVLSLVGILSGCADQPMATELTLGNSVQSSDMGTECVPTDRTEGTNTPTPASGATWEEELDFGKLVYTVTEARVVTSVNDIPSGGFRYDAEVSILGSDGKIARSRYPDFIQDDGFFADEVALVLLDITVQSHDATNRMIHPESGEIYWLYENQYIFRADGILCLIDKTEGDGTFYRYYDPVFYSGWNQYSEHPSAYELLPGKSLSFTIGFLIGSTSHGHPRDMSQLVASTSWGTLDKLYISLNLGGD